MGKTASSITQPVPLTMVGSTAFGRYQDVSVEQTFNMIISDEWLVPYAGYKKQRVIGNEGRGLFFSARANVMFGVFDDKLYILPRSLIPIEVGELLTSSGNVSITENDNNQVVISDYQNIYVYNYSTSVFSMPIIDFTPGDITFQNGYVISPAINSLGNPSWRLSAINDATNWPSDASSTGTFQTKPDIPQACVRFPSRGNLLWVMGKTVTEAWQDAGVSPFPYIRSSSYNVDYGCLNPNTIAEGDKFVVWLGSNEKSGPAIMYSEGGDITQISNDGINFRLAQLNNPSNAYGFLFKQDGHLFYQITFPDEQDNVTYTYDFNTNKFYTLCDENLNHHIAKQTVFFNNTYYFISFIDGAIYELSTNYIDYDYGNVVHIIPRIRFTQTVRMSNTLPFFVNNLSFAIEQGQPNEGGTINLSVSNDGGYTFSDNLAFPMNPVGKRRNTVNFRSLGYTNEFCARVRFNGFGRFVVGEGQLEVYQ